MQINSSGFAPALNDETNIGHFQCCCSQAGGHAEQLWLCTPLNRLESNVLRSLLCLLQAGGHAEQPWLCAPAVCGMEQAAGSRAGVSSWFESVLCTAHGHLDLCVPCSDLCTVQPGKPCVLSLTADGHHGVTRRLLLHRRQESAQTSIPPRSNTLTLLPLLQVLLQYGADMLVRNPRPGNPGTHSILCAGNSTPLHLAVSRTVDCAIITACAVIWYCLCFATH